MKHAIVHVGLHRCASTSIQKMLGSLRPRIEASGSDLILRVDMKTDYLLKQFRAIPRKDSIGLTGWWRRTSGWAGIARMSRDRLLISEESLHGTMPGHSDKLLYPRHGQIWTALASWRNLVVHPRLVVRRQDRWLESLYGFRVASGLACDFDEFMAGFDPSRMDYGVLLKCLERLNLLDRTRVGVLEDWSRRGALNSALNFLDLPVDVKFARFQRNQRLPANALRVLVAVNRCIGDTLSKPQRASINNAIRKLAPQSGYDEIAAVLEATLPDQLHGHIAAVLAAQRQIRQPSFTDEERTRWRSALKDRNRQFLAHSAIDSDADIWDDG